MTVGVVAAHDVEPMTACHEERGCAIERRGRDVGGQGDDRVDDGGTWDRPDDGEDPTLLVHLAARRSPGELAQVLRERTIEGLEQRRGRAFDHQKGLYRGTTRGARGCLSGRGMIAS